MIWESPLSNKHGPLFADTCENLMEGHHGGPPRKFLTLLLYEAFSVTLWLNNEMLSYWIGVCKAQEY